MAGEIEEVVPLDEADLLEQAKPIAPDGKVCFDADKVQARHDAQVRAALAHGPYPMAGSCCRWPSSLHRR